MPLTSYYSIVRYVPDIIRDEGINIGVVLQSGVNGDRQISYAFVESFQRAAKIDPFVTTGVLERTIKSALERIIDAPDNLSLEELVARHSGGKVQLTPPRLTLVENIGTEIQELYQQFVWEDREARQQGVTDTKLRRRVVDALLNEGLNPERVRINKRTDPVRVRGRKFNHSFDMSVQSNGRPDFIRLLSFDVEHHTEKLESAKALIFDASDIQDRNDPVGVYSVLYPPKIRVNERSQSFLEARAILRDRQIPTFVFDEADERNRFIQNIMR